ncbi:MAG: alpha/beta hydrolase [Treponema sp.]|jgi:acetyl esterase/lipase|nr:alpha/beta hydrolase [Treponema sp.]
MKRFFDGAAVLLLAAIVLGACASNQGAGFRAPGQAPVRWTLQNAAYGLDKQQTLNIILPEGKNDVHAIVYIHGGFYTAGNKLWHPLFLTDFSEDHIFASIDYRLMRRWNNAVHIEEMMQDIDGALGKILEIAAERGVRVKDFILAGHSAGAHLALLYSYRYFPENDTRPIRIAACVSLAGPSDFTDDAGWSSMSYYGPGLAQKLGTLSWMGAELAGYPIELTQADWTNQANYAEYKDYIEAISPISYVYTTDKIPPTLLVHGIDDNIVPYSNSARLNEALDKTSVPHSFISPGGSGNNHMLGGAPGLVSAVIPIRYQNQSWVDQAKAWMESYLR